MKARASIAANTARVSSADRRWGHDGLDRAPARRVDVEAEFDRFVSGLVDAVGRTADASAPGAGRRGPQPAISAELVYEHALEVLDKHGLEALTIRRIAQDLCISTRTLYKRIGSRGDMVRNAVTLHYMRLTLKFDAVDCWESTAENWCVALHRHLVAHPNVTELLGHACAASIQGLVDQLVTIAVEHGISWERAADCCRLLARVTIGDAVVHVRAIRFGEPGDKTIVECVVHDADLRDTVQFILAGTSDQSRWRPAP
jgi:AcrR family transcriptional regulator